MRRIFSPTIFLLMIFTGALIASLKGQASADTIFLQPTTWYEIKTNPPTTLTVEPATMLVAMNDSHAFQSRAFWEYDVNEIVSRLASVDSAFIDINRLINPVDRNEGVIQLITYMADVNPTVDDWFNVAHWDTFQNGPLREGNNVFDVTAGVQYALSNNYSYFGVVIWVPSTTNGILMEVDSGATITLDGTPVPEPSTIFLIGSGLLGLLGLRKKFKK